MTINNLGQTMSELIVCKTCQRSISALAEACPGCGAPNAWRHEAIQHFLSVKDKLVAKPFTYEAGRATLVGQTAPGRPWWSVALALLAFLSVALAWVVGAYLWFGFGSVLAVVLWSHKRKCDWFKADLAQRSWESTDEKLWAPVRSSLGL